MLIPFLRRHPVPPVERPESADRVERRALEMWPRLNHRAIHRCSGDPARIAAHVARRTKLSATAIAELITDP